MFRTWKDYMKMIGLGLISWLILGLLLALPFTVTRGQESIVVDTATYYDPMIADTLPPHPDNMSVADPWPCSCDVARVQQIVAQTFAIDSLVDRVDSIVAARIGQWDCDTFHVFANGFACDSIFPWYVPGHDTVICVWTKPEVGP